MKLESLQPHPAVSGFVSHLIVIENDSPPAGFVLPLIANSYPSLIFQTADSGPAPIPGGKFHTLSLNGQYVTPIELPFQSRFVLIACFFHPHVLKSLFGIDAAELTDKSIDLSLIKPAEGKSLRERLLNADSAPFRLRLIHDFVWGLIHRDPEPEANAATAAIGAIRRSKGLVSMGAIQDRLGISERALQRVFESDVGVSPRMFGRICRFQSAFQQLEAGRFSKLSDLAYDNGFSDQSHLVRVFKEFTGLTPTEYLRKRSELAV